MEEYPWLVQGVTLRSDSAGQSFDLALFGEHSAGPMLARWERLRLALGAELLIHARQRHGNGIRLSRAAGTGLHIAAPCDGHLGRDVGVVLAVSVADCVPVFILEPESRTVGLLHAGWRGAAAGILERGIEAMYDRFGHEPEALHLHLGPSISGARYEVGPEVFEALGLPRPSGPGNLDLREHIRERAERAGCSAERVGSSAVCVADDPRFFSHRGGDMGRQMALMGICADGRGQS